MNCRKSLVIVDLQPEFLASINRRVIDHTIRLVSQAKSENAYIFLLEYDGAGVTIPQITDAIGSYNLCKTVIKQQEGGGDEIHQQLFDNYLPFHCVVCGVNTYICVLDTLRELVHKRCQVDLAVEACRNGPFLLPKLLRKKKELLKSLGVNLVRTRHSQFVC